ncbi:hypothetical protein ElyMa_001258100 [Elysia marginata]|uniref:IF rod domain-containing protein n=1 Tax=Elysia marginata TaxID=1093978 RepID=A0AAV4ICY6_9GAST|nr:hypothetical protein ElyMa_001258100 [Elysia marginata]
MTTDTGDSDIREIRAREFIGEMKESRGEFNSRIGKLENGLRAMRRDVIGLKEVYSGMRKDISYMAEDLELIKERVRELEEKTEYSERYSRREKILIHGIKEEEKQFQDSKALVLKVLAKVSQNRNWDDRDIVRRTD